MVITPCAHARSGVKRSVLSVQCLSVCQPCKIEISQCTVAKPDKKMGIRKKEAFVYLIATKPLEFVAYGSSFLLNIGHFYGLQLRNSNTDVNTDVRGFWHMFILKIEFEERSLWILEGLESVPLNLEKCRIQ